MTTLHDLHDMGRAVDEHDLADLRTEARDLAANAQICAVCGGPDPDGEGECLPCFREDDDIYRRVIDQ